MKKIEIKLIKKVEENKIKYKKLSSCFLIK